MSKKMTKSRNRSALSQFVGAFLKRCQLIYFEYSIIATGCKLKMNWISPDNKRAGATAAATCYGSGTFCGVVSAAEIMMSGLLYGTGKTNCAVTPWTSSGSLQSNKFVY